MEEKRIPFRASLPFSLYKADVDTEGKNVYITVCVSDNLLDYQGDKMDIKVLEKIVQLAKAQKIELRRHHDDAFHIAISTDGNIEEEPNGRVSVYVTFKAVEIGDGEYYPEIHHLLKAINEGRKLPLEASVGGWITQYTTVLEKGRPVRIIKDAIVDHVALTPQKSAANPRTGIYQVFVKSLVHAIDSFEQEFEPSVSVEIGEAAEEKQEERGEVAVGITEKELFIEMEKCLRERMGLTYTRKDIEDLHRRSQTWGIPPIPTGNIVKPTIYLEHSEFADPVNYLFPLSKERLATTIEFFRKNPDYILSIYDPQTAGIVFARVIEKAISEGIPVSYTGVLMDALLPEPLACKLEGFNPNSYRLQRALVEQIADAQVRLVAGLYKSIYNSEELNLDEAENAIAEREVRYGYNRGSNAKLAPDAAFKGIPLSKFADPVGYNLPITPDWVFVSYRAFLRPEVRAQYDATAQKVIFKRILDGLDAVGARIVFNPADPLHRLFIEHPVFLGADDYKEETNVGEGAEEEFAQYVENLRKQYRDELRKQSDAPVTAAEAPQYPFVIPAVSRMHPGKVLVSIYPAFMEISKEAKKDKAMLQLFALSEILRALGIKESWDKPKDTKLVWVGEEKEAQNPIVDDKNRLPEGESIVEVGMDLSPVKIVGKLAIKKSEPERTLVEYYVFSDGSVSEVVHLNWEVPLRKDSTPFVGFLKAVAEAISKEFSVPAEEIDVECVTPEFVVWSLRKAETFATPIEVEVMEDWDGLENFKLKVSPTKIPVVQHFIPAEHKDVALNLLLHELQKSKEEEPEKEEKAKEKRDDRVAVAFVRD